MKKYFLPITLAIILIFGILYFLRFRNTNNNSDTNAERMSLENQNYSTNYPNENVNSDSKSKIVTATQGEEVELAKFSTKIYIDDDNRDTNMKITASKINGTIIKNGDSFSFNEMAGSPSPDEGYKEAGVIVDGKKVKGYGGGNCQVSTTIYNVAKKVDGIEITERHEHGVEVGYIEMGKDATVAYDDLDLKFKNNTGFDVRLYVEVTEKNVIAKITKCTF